MNLTRRYAAPIERQARRQASRCRRADPLLPGFDGRSNTRSGRACQSCGRELAVRYALAHCPPCLLRAERAERRA